MTVEWRFEKRDAWVGLFWDRQPTLAVYVCLIPFFPILFRATALTAQSLNDQAGSTDRLSPEDREVEDRKWLTRKTSGEEAGALQDALGRTFDRLDAVRRILREVERRADKIETTRWLNRLTEHDIGEAVADNVFARPDGGLTIKAGRIRADLLTALEVEK